MLAVTGLWGACYVVISWGLRDAAALWYASLRAGVAAAALFVVVRAQHRPSPRTPGDWLLVAGMALGNVAVAFGGMFAGTRGVPTGVASVLANTQALLILLPAWWLF
ncbi:MAG: EamA family transporter, partial [Actinomycetes bacterium]